MRRVDAYAERFVASVFGYDPVVELTGQQQREPVPGFGATDTTGSPGDDW